MLALLLLVAWGLRLVVVRVAFLDKGVLPLNPTWRTPARASRNRVRRWVPRTRSSGQLNTRVQLSRPKQSRRQLWIGARLGMLFR